MARSGLLQVKLTHSLSICSYGSTENCGAASRVVATDFTSAGTVGPPGISLEWKLVDVPALGYTSEDKPNPRGEICTRGAPNFIGYFKGWY